MTIVVPALRREPASPGMASYDQTITALMRQYHIPGGAVAILTLYQQGTEGPAGDAFVAALDNGMWTASRAVTSWPTADLFGEFH